MAIDVTVLGAAGSTVTIPFTSATNAAAAQAALGTITDLVRTSALQQYTYPGAGSVPAPSLMGGVVMPPGTANVGVLPGGVYSFVDPSGPTNPGMMSTTVVSATNPMTVAGGQGGMMLLNGSANMHAFFAGGTNVIGQGLASANLNVGVDAGDTHVDARLGAATIHAYQNSLIQVMGGAAGSSQVFAHGNNTVAVLGATDGHAVSVFGQPINDVLGIAPPTHNLGVIGTAGTDLYINAGADNLVVGANAGNLTVIGGSGNDLVLANHGYIDGGTGTNNLISDSLAGATTLVSQGFNDTVIGQGNGNTYISRGTNTTIADLSSGSGAGGATYITDGGNATIMGSVAANSTFNLGAGTVLAYGQHGEDLSRGNIYTDAYNGANDITIGDFVAGHDVFSLSSSASHATLSSIHYYDDAATSAFGSVGTQAILSDGTTINFLHFNITNSSFT